VELSNQAGRMRELLSVFRLGGTNVDGVSDDMHMNYRRNSSKNEQIISLNDNFGKY
jgi:hypothetical protein